MPEHNILQKIKNAGTVAEPVDPGDAGSIVCDRSPQVMMLKTAAAETRTLADPDAPNAILILMMHTDGGDCVVTASTAVDQNSNTQLTFDDVDDIAVFVSAHNGTKNVWRCIASHGIAELAYDGDVLVNNLKTSQAFIPIPLTCLREASSMDVGNTSANGGVLASNTTPILEAINGATDGCQRVNWAASNNDQVLFSIPLPPDIDTSADLVLHTRFASGGTTDAVGFTVDSWFNEGDTKVSDTSATNQTTTYAEKTTTIAAADVPSGAQTLTVGLTPVNHTTDTMLLTSVWLEYTRTLLTS